MKQIRKFEQFFRFDNYQTAVAKQNEVRASELPNLNIIDRVPLLNNFEPLLIGHFAEYINLIEATQSKLLLQAADVGMVYEPERRVKRFTSAKGMAADGGLLA